MRVIRACGFLPNRPSWSVFGILGLFGRKKEHVCCIFCTAKMKYASAIGDEN